MRAAGAGVGAGHDEVVDLLGADAGVGQRAGAGLLTQRQVLGLAELLLPLLRPVVARRAPAVEELLGGAARAEQLGQQRTVGVGADQQRGRRVATGRLVGAAGQARCGCRR